MSDGIIGNIAFRVDATKKIGIGHLMRCFALSEELVKRKNTCYFLSNIDSEKLCEKIDESNMKLEKISTSPKSVRDIERLINFSKKNNVDWIVTDHYDIDSEYIKELKANGFKVLSIDDTSQIHYPSDLVVNQNVGSEKLEFDTDDSTKFLLGPKYVMIRDELLRRKEKRIKKNVEKILVTLGGIDHGDLTLQILKILKEIIDKNVEIIVVIGPLNKINDDFQSKINEEDNPNFRFVFSPENMADLYLESDIAISAGGSSCYELAYFGIPNIIITVADNQLNIAKKLDKKNVSVYIGRKEDFSSKKLKENLLELINNSSQRGKMIKNGMSLVNGQGKKRIIECMNTFK